MTPETYLEAQREQILAQLLEFLRIPSISTDPAHAGDVRAAAEWVASRLRAAGPLAVSIRETGGHPVVHGSWLGAPGRPTLLVYGHYDVQPPDPLEEWHSPPFEPDLREGRIYARGASDDKGSMFLPLKVAEAFFAADGRLPINLKLVLEGEEEVGSVHLESFIAEHTDLLAADYALSADGGMWRPTEPCVILGSRGLVSLDLDVYGPNSDLHSGRHGGGVLNPLHAIATIIAGLHDDGGAVAVAGFYDGVAEMTAEERRQVATLDFDAQAYAADIGVPALHGDQRFGTLERQWYRPTLDVNGLYGGYQGPGSKTVIPASAHAKISCRLVPGQDPDRVLAAVVRHLETHAPAGVRVRATAHEHGAPAYRIDAEHPGLRIARDVLRRLYHQEPATVLMGGTVPISYLFKKHLGCDTVYFSFSTGDEQIHAPNEFFRVQRLWDGLAAWIDFWRTAGNAKQA